MIPARDLRGPIAVAALVMLATGATADTIHVPGDQPTIQAGIDTAVDGDDVLVAPGTYFENLDFDGKAITVHSSSGADLTVIDGGGSGWLVEFRNGEGPDSVLQGFRLTNGYGGAWMLGASPRVLDNTITGCGRGLLCQGGTTAWIEGNLIDDNDGQGIGINDSSPTILRNTISRNRSTAVYGGGIGCEVNCAPLIQGNLIEENTLVDGVGVGIACHDHSPAVIRGNVIRGNHIVGGYFFSGTGGGIGCQNSDALIEQNWIVDNEVTADSFFDARGGGIALIDSAATVRGNVLAGNVALSSDPSRGGGLWCSGVPIALEGNTITENFADVGPGLYLSAGASTVAETIVWGNGAVPVVDVGVATFQYCDIEGGWSGVGNLDQDPEFVDPAQSDWSLKSSSPCVDAGDPASPKGGRDLGGLPRSLDGDLDRGMFRDMGAHEFSHVHLALSGDATPGGTLTLDLTGTVGMKAWLWIGFAEDELLFNPYGSLFLDIGGPHLLMGVGKLDRSLSGTLPANLPVGTLLVFQSLAASGGAGNLSNAAAVLLE